MSRVRPHAKIHTSIRHHTKTAELFADNDMFAFYTRLMLLAIERFAARNGGKFLVHENEIPALAGRKRRDYGELALTKLVASSPLTATKLGDSWEIIVPNFAIKQGFENKNCTRTREELQPLSTEVAENTEYSPPTEVAATPPRAPPTDVSGFIKMLTGELPLELDGTRFATAAQWFEHHAEIIRGEAEGKTGETSGTKFNGVFKSTLMRYWNHKRPKQARASPGRQRPSRLERIDEKLRQQREAANASQTHPDDPESPGTPRGGEPIALGDAFRLSGR